MTSIDFGTLITTIFVDERIAAEGVLETVKYSHIYADKGFISADWLFPRCLRRASPTLVARFYRIWTLTRENQHLQHSDDLKRFISRVRQRVEGVFHEIHAYWS
ncbi:hypothetical protein LC586_07175 [Nostoc sp. CHAB 5714]|uniref:Transposase n=2 Tax=Nostoc TaxID=1177 RepID=A0ABS8I4V3_9NOSO|nr:hypothetical protein [Nostoc favosum CHAB5714]